MGKKRGEGVLSTVSLGARRVLLGMIILLAAIIIILIILTDFNTNSPSLPVSYDQFSLTNYLHWDHMPLTLIIEDKCNGYVKSRIRKAFVELSNKTDNMLSFFELKYDPSRVADVDIVIACNSSFPLNTLGGEILLTQAEATITDMSGNTIKHAGIIFYNVDPVYDRYSGGCMNYPDVEIHEILHILGFSHVNQKTSILSPQNFGCRYSIDKGIIDLIKATYGYKNEKENNENT